MYCPDCGRRNDDDAQFCSQCGVSLAGGRSRGVPGSAHGPHELVHRASELKDRGDIGGAIELCRRAIVGEPRHRGGHALLGLLYEQMGQTTSAIREYRVVLEIDPNSTAEREKLDMLLGDGAEESTALVRPWWRRGRRSWQLAGVAAVLLGAGVLVLSIGVLNRQKQQQSPTPAVALATQRAPAEGAGTVQRAAPGAVRPRSARPPYPVRPRGASPFELRRTPGTAVSRPGVQPRGRTATSRPQTRTPARPRVPEAPRGPSGFGDSIPPVRLIPGSSLETSVAAASGIVTPVGEQSLEVRLAEEEPEGGRTAVEVVAEAADEEEPRPTAHIEIWRSSPEGRVHVRPTTEPADASPQPQVENGLGRTHQLNAGQLRQQGRYAEAMTRYEAAITAYARSIEEGLAGMQAVKGIESCKRAIAACQAALGES